MSAPNTRGAHATPLAFSRSPHETCATVDTDAYKYVILFLGDFFSILNEALPFIVLGAVIAGFIEELVPQRLITRFLPRNRLPAIAMSALLGLIFPMCECGIVPVMRRLLRKGLPLGCCVSYMLAGPIINPIVIASTWAAFTKYGFDGHWIITLRVLLGFLTAFVAGLIVSGLHSREGNELLKPIAVPSAGRPENDAENGPAAAPRPWSQRLSNISETALHDFVDITLFLILGALLASFVGLTVHKDKIGELSRTYPALAILSMMGMAIVLCLCSEADAFVAASFTTLHPAAKLAFLVLGPMLDIKLLLLYTRVFRFRLIRVIVSAVVVQVFLYTLVCYYLWEEGILRRVTDMLQGMPHN